MRLTPYTDQGIDVLPLHILTIVLDGIPFLPMQLARLNNLKCDWHWHIVEGQAANVNCTAWCKPQRPRVSEDGSHEFLLTLRGHPRVSHSFSTFWNGGKLDMCNHAIEHIHEPCVLIQVDVDELWTTGQLDRIGRLLSPPGDIDSARFFCRYFVGPNIVTLGENCYGNKQGEWDRAWRFQPGMKFMTHEPPSLSTSSKHLQDREANRDIGLVFDHLSYVLESQVAYKEKFYGYSGAVDQWKRLQSNTVWPVRRLKDFLPWVDDQAQANLLHKP